jgi:hypothetical protein
MPAQWDLGITSSLNVQIDPSLNNRLPVYMAKQQVAQQQAWQRWATLFPKRKWQPNMGDTLVGVISEPSPIPSQEYRPRNITETPTRALISSYERTNASRVKRGQFTSQMIPFLPTFRDFDPNKIQFYMSDIARQITFAREFFIRSAVYHNSPYVYVVGGKTGVNNTPIYLDGEAALPTDTSASKDAGKVTNWINNIGAAADGFLTYNQILAAASYAQNYLGILPYQPASGAPAENAVLKGQFLLLGGSDIWDSLPHDSHVLGTKPLAMNLLNEGFKGSIGGKVMFKEEFFDMRYKASDASLPAPQIDQLLADSGYSTPNATNQTVLTPDYALGRIGVAFLVGSDGYEDLEVGPPPAPFSGGGKMSGAEFNKLQWNGEVRLDKNMLVNYNGTLDTNSWGDYVRLIADATFGIIAKNRRAIVPIFYRRRLAPSLTLNQA